MRDIAKSAEALGIPAEVTNIMRRAFSQVRNGRGGPVIVGFQSESPATLEIAGKTLSGRGVVKDRIVLPAGPVMASPLPVAAHAAAASNSVSTPLPAAPVTAA